MSMGIEKHKTSISVASLNLPSSVAWFRCPEHWMNSPGSTCLGSIWGGGWGNRKDLWYLMLFHYPENNTYHPVTRDSKPTENIWRIEARPPEITECWPQPAATCQEANHIASKARVISLCFAPTSSVNKPEKINSAFQNHHTKVPAS